MHVLQAQPRKSSACSTKVKEDVNKTQTKDNVSNQHQYVIVGQLQKLVDYGNKRETSMLLNRSEPE